MKKSFLVALLFLLLPLQMFALPPNMQRSSSNLTSTSAPPPPLVVVATFLSLSESQRAEFEQLLSGFLTTVHSLEEQKQALQKVLEQRLNAPSPNPAQIGQLVLRIHALDQQLALAVQSFHQSFLSLLTPDQAAKLEAVTQAAQLQPVVGAFVALYLVPPPAPGQ